MHIAENFAGITAGGERRLTDILHISEPLQEAGTQLESEHALARWLSQHILEPDSNASSQQMRPESDKHLVQDCHDPQLESGRHIHWSGMPFITNFRVQKQAFSSRSPPRLRQFWILMLRTESVDHRGGRTSGGRSAFALRGADTFGLALQSRRCTAGARRRGDKKGDTDVHQSALGRLLQKGEPQDAAGLRTRILKRYAMMILPGKRHKLVTITNPGRLMMFLQQS
ncbi:hypothetical protein MWG58_31700 [Streptomyces sp. WAC00276]|uniref:hypothetical protein n=1 Tax=Streptomyces sp. WAC00276 TaxID=2933778 RepID=UPI001FFF670B|nr:hypothetical protein [Streptomyces sp. WAC00276]MCK2145390.1 hypothetical protein [Streptomyces sp. WAC00276]